MNSSRGSEWRKWDLHIHTASSYDYKYKGNDADALLCNDLMENSIAAASITDHFKIDVERIEHLRQLAPDIVFFPGVELRCDKGSTNVHVILIFSDKCNLKELHEDFQVEMIRSHAKFNDDPEKIYWDFKDIVEFGRKHSAFITVHAGKKSNGIDTEMTNALPMNMAVKEEYASNVDFFEIGRLKDVAGYKEHVFNDIKEKPLIICSDNHNPRDYKLKENLWIKADLTFEGLKQCILQPSDRVFIGNIPPALDRENKNRRNTIKSISVSRIENPVHNDMTWFDFDIPLNSNLVAIIGNKGSGKSALSDIIGHSCKCSTMENASFLNEKRFRKSPKNYASDYQAKIIWGDNHTEISNLGDDNYDTSIENGQYLPQEFIESICNDMDDQFQHEIDRVIFSYVEDSEKGNAKNLDELVKNKMSPINIGSENIFKALHDVNERIINLENKKTRAYRKHIEDGLKKANEDLIRHESQKPQEVKKPEPKKDNKGYEDKLKQLDEKISQIKQDINQKNERIKMITQTIDDGKLLAAKMGSLSLEIETINKEIELFAIKYNICLINKKISLNSPAEEIKAYIDSLSSEKEKIHDEIYGNDNIEGLNDSLLSLLDERNRHVANADREEQLYQKYIADVNEWKIEKQKLLGDIETEGTLKYFENENKYINSLLEQDYQKLISSRIELLRKIFHTKEELATVYDLIYEPIQGKILNLLGEMEEKIEFKAQIQLCEANFDNTILNYINQKMSGKFHGKNEGHDLIDKCIKRTEFDDINSLIEFVNFIAEAVTEDVDSADKKIKDRQQFYDYLFSLQYVNVSFKLRVGNRSLDELSPGERGIVLLIFYLALSKDNTPIIVDQPEDNLDNQSVYSKLVPCINAAKQNRQVIIVTHNPNIAVACDAEQIIYCCMDKSTHHISYSSGAIENEAIRQHVIEVLEGTMPAFDLRRRKYKDPSENSDEYYY